MSYTTTFILALNDLYFIHDECKGKEQLLCEYTFGNWTGKDCDCPKAMTYNEGLMECEGPDNTEEDQVVDYNEASLTHEEKELLEDFSLAKSVEELEKIATKNDIPLLTRQKISEGLLGEQPEKGILLISEPDERNIQTWVYLKGLKKETWNNLSKLSTHIIESVSGISAAIAGYGSDKDSEAGMAMIFGSPAIKDTELIAGGSFGGAVGLNLGLKAGYFVSKPVATSIHSQSDTTEKDERILKMVSAPGDLLRTQYENESP